MTEANASIQEQVYQTLRGRIMSFIDPPGTSMSTQETAARLNVSRTPVREAFIRLQRDGLVSMLPKRETLVSPISMERVRQERFIRQSLECSVLAVFPWRQAGSCLEAMNGLIVRQLSAGVERRQEELLALDDAFHRLLFQAAGMDLAWEFLSENNTHYQRIRLLSLWQSDRADQVILQHQEYLRALEIGRLRTAEEILMDHIMGLNNEEKGLRRQFPDYFA